MKYCDDFFVPATPAWIAHNYIEGYGNGIRLKVSPIAFVTHNTLVDCATGVLARRGSRREFLHNLLINCDVPLTIADPSLPEILVSDYNCIYDFRNPPAAEKWLGAWRARTGKARHSFVKAPRVLGTWPGPMALAPGSPCIGAGQKGATIGAFAVAPADRRPADRQPPVGRIACGGQAVGGAGVLVRDADVTLQIAARDGEGPVTAMRFSNDGERWSPAVAFAPRHAWSLAPGDGKRVVYAQFRDRAGNWSSPVTTEVWCVPQASQAAGGRTGRGARGFVVSTSGDDEGPGSLEKPWRTLARAARAAAPGDTVTVRAGIYYEPLVLVRGGASAERRITYRADGRVIIERGQKWPYGVLLQNLKFVTIEGFECRGWTRSGIHVDGCSDILIQRNRIHSGLAERLTQRKPYVGTYGIYVRSSQRIQMRHNVVYWNSNNIFTHHATDCRIEHNTLTDSVYTGLGVFGAEPGKGFRITDNIIAFNGNSQVRFGNKPRVELCDYNCWLKAKRSKCMFESGGQFRGRGGMQRLEEWQKRFGLDKHSISVDPGFVDADQGDLRLKKGSPCEGAGSAGTNIGAHETPQAVPAPRVGSGGRKGTTAPVRRKRAPTAAGGGPAVPAPQALAGTREAVWIAAANATAMFREQIISGVRAGRCEAIYVDVGGSALRGRIVAAGADRIVVSFPSGIVPIPWQALSPHRFAALAAKYAEPTPDHQVKLAALYAKDGALRAAVQLLDGLRLANEPLVQQIRLLAQARP